MTANVKILRVHDWSAKLHSTGAGFVSDSLNLMSYIFCEPYWTCQNNLMCGFLRVVGGGCRCVGFLKIFLTKNIVYYSTVFTQKEGRRLKLPFVYKNNSIQCGIHFWFLISQRE